MDGLDGMLKTSPQGRCPTTCISRRETTLTLTHTHISIGGCLRFEIVWDVEGNPHLATAAWRMRSVLVFRALRDLGNEL
jgi:hypothetical protein